jgi:hypothetical protein
MEKVRIQLEVPESRYNELKALMEECHFSTQKELFNTAYTLLEWAVRERHQGRMIASVDEQNMKYKELSMPALDQIRPKPAEKSPGVMSDHPL